MRGRNSWHNSRCIDQWGIRVNKKRPTAKSSISHQSYPATWPCPSPAARAPDHHQQQAVLQPPQQQIIYTNSNHDLLVGLQIAWTNPFMILRSSPSCEIKIVFGKKGISSLNSQSKLSLFLRLSPTVTILVKVELDH